MLSSFIVLAAAHLSAADFTASETPAVIAPVAQPVQVTIPAPAAPSTPAPEIIPIQAEPVEPPQNETEAQTDAASPSPATADTNPEPGLTPEESVDTAPAEEAETPQPAADPSIVSPTERRAILRAAENALARVETARGRFVQLDINGGLSEGSFALQRPGRMRFDYDDPVPILIASDGTTVAMRDDELETVDRVPLAATPLDLLLSDSVNFEEDTDIIRVQRASGMVAITVADPSGETDGQLSLIFDAGTYDLISWRVIDADGGVTSVSLSDFETGITLNPRLFIVQDFEDEEDDRRR